MTDETNPLDVELKDETGEVIEPSKVYHISGSSEEHIKAQQVAFEAQKGKGSSTYELSQAVGALAGIIIDSSFGVIDGYYTSLGSAASCARSFAEKYAKVNTEVSAGWENIAQVNDKLDNSVQTIMRKYIEALRAFVDTTSANEKKTADAAAAVVEAGKEILSKLGIDD